MAVLTIPNTFIEGQPAPPNQVNENFTAVQAVVNALNEDNLDTDAVGTDEIQDNAVTNAKMADDSVDTAEIVDDAVTGAKTVLAVENGARGTVLVETGDVTIASATTSGAITMSNISKIMIVQVYIKIGSNYFFPNNTSPDSQRWHLFLTGDNTFKIANGFTDSKDFYWKAIGI